jgi:hypothetical protein
MRTANSLCCLFGKPNGGKASIAESSEIRTGPHSLDPQRRSCRPLSIESNQMMPEQALAEISTKLDRLITWAAVHDAKHEAIDEKIRNFDSEIYGDGGIKEQVEKNRVTGEAKKQSVVSWQQWLLVLGAVATAVIPFIFRK